MAGPASRTRPPATLPYRFAVDGHQYLLPHRPGRWWLRVLTYETPGCWWQIIPAGLDGNGPKHLVDRLTDPKDRFDLDDIEQVAEQVVQDVLGIGLYPAQKLMRMAYGNWLQFDAWCISKGLSSLMDDHPARMCSAVYSWRLDACQKKTDLAKLDNEIFASPPARHASGKLRDPAKARGWDEQTESDAFMKAMANYG